MADNDGKIYITISDRRFGSNVAEADEQNKVDKNKEQSQNNDSSALGDFAKHSFFSLIRSQARGAVNYTVGNIGNFVGNYAAQEHMQEAMQFANSLIGVGVSALAGFKIAGLPGAIVAAGTNLIGSGINEAQKYYSGLVQNRRQNNDIAQLRARAGLNSTNNGSRGTEY